MLNASRYAIALVAVVLSACATVHPEDTEAWIGQPVNVLDKQPLFLSMPVVRTEAADGTQIRNYVNSRNISSCSGGGSIFGSGGVYGYGIGFASYSDFTSCMQSVAACNNIFYIVNGRIQRVVLLGTGGMQCSTDRRFRPDYSGTIGDR